MSDYSGKHDEYFAAARKDIEPLLAPRAASALELGCGAGATLEWLKRSGRVERTVGIEIHPPAAELARGRVNEIHCLDFEKTGLPLGTERFELILCLDVLEHLVDPWGAIDRLVNRHLASRGIIIASIPNVRHYSVVLPLAFRGRWDYQDHGLLDRTHLRFFTRSSARALVEHPRLEFVRCLCPGFESGTRKGLFNRLTLGIFEDLLAYHYLVSATTSKD